MQVQKRKMGRKTPLSAEKERNAGRQIERIKDELHQVEKEQQARQAKLEEAREKLLYQKAVIRQHQKKSTVLPRF